MKAKRNRLGRFVKSARRHVRRARNRLGHFIAGGRKPVRRKARRASTTRRAVRRRNPPQRLRVLTMYPGGSVMPSALVANPRKRRGRKHRARTASGRFVKTSRRRRGSRRRRAATNPRRRHHHRRHYRRNPGGGFVRSLVGALLPMGLGGIGGALSGAADAKLMADKPVISALSKVVVGALGAALLRKRPALAFGWAGGVMGSLGYSLGVKAAGGLVAHNPAAALKGIADMAQDDPEMAALLEGLGDIVPNDGMGDATDEYSQALGDEDDGVGDIVEAD